MGVTESLQALQPAPRIIYDSLNCTYQLVPFEGCYTRVAILDTLHQMHAPVVETLVVDDQTAWLVLIMLFAEFTNTNTSPLYRLCPMWTFTIPLSILKFFLMSVGFV